MKPVKKIAFFFGCVCLIFQACGQKQGDTTVSTPKIEIQTKATTLGNTIETRFPLPEAYVRSIADSTSFDSYLRSLPLKPINALVSYYYGETKPNRNIYEAVIDLPIGKRDLHQCADAVMRLRAEYLFQNKKFDSIHFNFTNGFRADYANWRKGKRIVVNGNKVSWIQNSKASDSPKYFWKYLEMVFSYAGTASLEKEMKPITVEEMQIGDVFIQGGFPGHAVIIVDMAINQTTKEKIFLLAQSYMPAQELQILKNPDNTTLNPWYRLSEISEELKTPEWTFSKFDLKRFRP